MSEFSTLLRLANDKVYYKEMSSKYNETDISKLSDMIDSDSFPFVRDFVYKLDTALTRFVVTFLTGPRRCGKTVGLRQILSKHSNAIYLDIKSMEHIEASKHVEGICNSIRSNKDIIYLIDEFTYFKLLEAVMSDIATAIADKPTTRTKLVITGSQRRTLKYLHDLVFSSSAALVDIDFLSYSEWLRYTNSIASRETYEGYLLGIEEFYKSTTVLEYLEGSLKETVISNTNTVRVIPNNCIDLLTADYILDVLFSLLVHLHDPIKWQALTNRNALQDKVEYAYKKAVDENRLSALLRGRYNRFKGSSVDSFKQCIRFLYNCKLVTVTKMGKEFTYQSAFSVIDECSTKDEILDKVNICVRHPFFFMALVHHIYGEPVKPTSSILGSIVECHARAYLPSDYCFEYKDDSAEVDYVYTGPYVAIEFTVSKKHADHSHVLPDNYKFVMLSDKTFPQSIVSIEQDAISFLNSIYGKE